MKGEYNEAVKMAHLKEKAVLERVKTRACLIKEIQHSKVRTRLEIYVERIPISKSLLEICILGIRVFEPRYAAKSRIRQVTCSNSSKPSFRSLKH